MQAAYDLSKMLIPFDQLPKGKKLVKHYPELAAFDEFTSQTDDNILKIAFCTADADSPFLKLRADHTLMLTAIFEFLDIDTKSSVGKDLFKQVLEYKHPGVAKCWSAYLQMQYNIDFNDWAISQQTYDMLLSESTRQKEDKESTTDYANWRVKIRNQIRLLGEDLKKIEPMIFKDSKMAKPVATEERKKIRNYPEKYAESQTLL